MSMGKAKAVVGLALMLGLSGCAKLQFLAQGTKELQTKAISGNASQAKTGNGHYKVGDAYQIDGIWYYPAEDWSYDETGIASWYGPNFHGKPTANGETFDQEELTAAHNTLPMPSLVRVTNLENGRSLVLRVNDRGPFAKGRIIDISKRGAELLGFKVAGTAPVRVRILRDQSLALKARMLGEADLAEAGSPITVSRLPKGGVRTAELAPPPGASASPVLKPVTQAPFAPPPLGTGGGASGETLNGVQAGFKPAEQIQNVSVAPADIFVQAAAFTDHQNALKSQIRLSTIGTAMISHVLVNGRDFYRVRVGPLASVADADLMLSAVNQMGFKGARIIVAKTGG